MKSMLWAAAAASLLVACGDDGPPDDGMLVIDGGRFTVEGCAHEVITRVNAEAPALGADVLGAEPAPYQVHLGLAGDPRTSIVIVWRTDAETTSTIAKFGEGTGLGETAAGVTYRFVAGVGGVGDAYRIHEAHLCGLEPGTEYSYQVGGVGAGGDERFSPTYTFRTAPDVTASPDAEVTIAYAGDTRNGYAEWAQIADVITDHAPDVLIYTGDIVTLGPLQEEWDGFFDSSPELFATVPMVSAHGNHEINSISYYAQLAMPGDEENFAFDYGHLHQVVVNSDPTAVGDLDGKIPDFLDADLGASDAAWNVVAVHRGLYSSGSNHGSDLTLRAAWGPIFDAHQVDLVVQGHDHIYERTKPMRAEVPGATPADGTIYLVSGGGGANLYGTSFGTKTQEPFTEFAESTYNTTVVQVRATMLSATSYRADGSLLDEFTITKP